MSGIVASLSKVYGAHELACKVSEVDTWVKLDLDLMVRCGFLKFSATSSCKFGSDMCSSHIPV